MRLLIMGPPGAGKGTQAARLASFLQIPAISTGDIFRANVAGRTELGLQAQRYVAAGEYVPDEITNGMVRSRLSEPDARDGWLLDGYPRTLAQVAELDDIAASSSGTLHGVLALHVDEDELVRRLAHRAAVEGRVDDTESVIRRRQQLYQEQTTPLLQTYADRGLLLTIDGRGHVDHVHGEVRAAVETIAARRTTPVSGG